MNATIAAVIVTFNRKKLLLENIKMCLTQTEKLDEIIVIDNHSEDGSQTYVMDNLSSKQLDVIDYVYLKKNVGGSGGFSYGVEYAKKGKFDYIWLMDDDGRPYDNMTLSKLTQFITEENLLNKPVWLNSLVCCNNKDLAFGIFVNNTIVTEREKIGGKFITGSANPFNGTLLSKELVDLIGKPRDDYFIKGDEKEYLARALKNNLEVYTVCDSIYFHPTPRHKSGSFSLFGKTIENNVEAGWKEYYNMRNTCLNLQMYSAQWKSKSIKFYIGRVIRVVLYGEKKAETFKMCTVGFLHALLGKTGTYYLPGNKKVD